MRRDRRPMLVRQWLYRILKPSCGIQPASRVGNLSVSHDWIRCNYAMINNASNFLISIHDLSFLTGWLLDSWYYVKTTHMFYFRLVSPSNWFSRKECTAPSYKILTGNHNIVLGVTFALIDFSALRYSLSKENCDASKNQFFLPALPASSLASPDRYISVWKGSVPSPQEEHRPLKSKSITISAFTSASVT